MLRRARGRHGVLTVNTALTAPTAAVMPMLPTATPVPEQPQCTQRPQHTLRAWRPRCTRHPRCPWSLELLSVEQRFSFSSSCCDKMPNTLLQRGGLCGPRPQGTTSMGQEQRRLPTSHPVLPPSLRCLHPQLPTFTQPLSGTARGWPDLDFSLTVWVGLRRF